MNENESKELKEILEARGMTEKASPSRKRELIKTLIIVFLAIMLVLTFFSNTIMNRSLAEISTDTVTSGKLEEKLRRTGIVESKQHYDVTAEGGKTIEKIHIKSGQEVKKGDVLFTVNAVSSETLEAEEEKLDAARLEYEKALVKEPADYTKTNQKIQSLRSELNTLISQRDTAKANEGSNAAAKAAYSKNKSEAARLADELTNIEMTIKNIDSDMYMDADVELIGDLASVFGTYEEAKEEYDAARSLYEEAVRLGSNAEVAKSDSDAKEAVKNAAQEAYNSAKKEKRSELVSKLAEVKSSAAEIKSKIDAYEENFNSSDKDYDTLAASVIQKQNELEEAIAELSTTMKSDSLSERKEAIELQSQKKTLDKLQEKVDKLKKEAQSTEITSKYDGVISTINVKLDEQTVEGTPLAVIDIVDEGYTVKLSVESKNMKKIKEGMKAEIMNNYRGDVEAVLTDIKNDITSGTKSKLLEFTVTGDVESGDSLDLLLTCGSGTYDTIVPLSALKTDNEGDYVYAVRSKNTPLGNRYYIEKVSVTKEADNGVSCAVSGNLNRSDYIMTASSKPVRAGEQVRMKDK